MLTLLTITLVALGLIVGLVKPNAAFRRLSHLILFSAFLPVGIGILRGWLKSLTAAEIGLLILGLAVAGVVLFKRFTRADRGASDRHWGSGIVRGLARRFRKEYL